MVKIMRSPEALQYYKLVYDKSLGTKVKFMWSKFKELHPTLAFFGPGVATVVSSLIVITVYLKANMNPVPKYYEHFVVYRPDDPRVSSIRKDDSLTYGASYDYNTLGYEPA
ncbi:uncharacterized protein LOC143429363 [Xylocopa sonorina]|uniref:uncharacterized protein LOC143429363 n=1 Tax=Xylocopa sonorina TaxID=1818115 RepID=UPI00403AC3DE